MQALARPAVTLDAEVVPDPTSGLPRRIKGTMRVSGWTTDGRGHCLYMPLLDPDYGDDRATSRRFELLTDKNARPAYEGVASSVTAGTAPGPAGGGQSGAHTMRLDLPPGTTEAIVNFESTIPRIAGSAPDDWFFDGFHPELLGSCDEGPISALSVDMEARVKIPPEWDYGGLGHLAEGGTMQSRFTGRALTFSLTRGLKRQAFQAGAVPVELVYRSAKFTQLQTTLETVMPRLEQMFGPFPFPSLTVVETTELQRHVLPGLIALNKPAQALFDTAQSDWLNWQHWILAVQLARQWYGASIAPATPDDEWLITGIAEFATLEALRTDPKRYDLFNADEDGGRFLSFDYLQFQGIQAANLRRSAPFATLTTPDFATRASLLDQAALLHVKHAVAMRQLKNYAGEAAFFGFTRNLTTAFLHDRLGPRDLMRFLGRLPSPFSPATRKELEGQLAQWWVKEGWPDFALEDFEVVELPDGRFVAKVEARQEGAIDYPPLVGVEDELGRKYTARATRQGDAWIAEIVTDARPRKAIVDPSHETFDEDRFNNSSSTPAIRFFPGSANTLADDAYTVVWSPYAFRRPGEPFSLGLQAVGFRYIQGGLFFRAEHAPAENLTAFGVRHRYQSQSRAIHGDLSFDQDYENDRLVEATVVRSPVFAEGPTVSVSLRLRHRERANEADTRHETGVVGLSIKPSGAQRACGYQLSMEVERAPEGLAHGFEYERKTGAAQGECRLFGTRATLGTRVFGGALWKRGAAPESVLFKPNDLRETRLRLDARGLERVPKITTVTTDLGLPFYLPLPSDSLILTRQMRWRLFYDAGRSYSPRNDYRSSGVGFTLPFGGDLSGAGSLSLTRLSVLGILYTSLNGEVSRKSSIVFDLTGEL